MRLGLKKTLHETELENSNLEMKRLNYDLAEFACVVSHDLKAPLRAVSNLAVWLKKDYADKLDAEGKEMFRLLLHRVRRMHNLIEGVLAYSRLIHKHDDPEVTDLNRLVAEVISDIAVPSHIRITVMQCLPTITSNRTRVVQLFQNLISNAVKYMDKPQGEIRIDYEEIDPLLRFSVSDNGPGIEERYFNRIFQLFQTLHNKEEYESTGVGLSLVKKIVEQEGGSVWLESQVGQGTKFYFTFPDSHKTIMSQSDQSGGCGD
jgi:two-component system, LuxR family, sensor kinase FixL